MIRVIDMDNYKMCPLKKRPVVYKEEPISEPVDDQPQDLSLKRKAEDVIEAEAKRNFPLNLTANSMYDRMRSEKASPVYTRPESPVSISSETSHSSSVGSSPAPLMDPEYPIHLRGLSPSTTNYSSGFVPYNPLAAVWKNYHAHQALISAQPPLFNYHQMTPPSSPGSYSTTSSTASSEPEDLSIRNDIPLPALFHVFEEAPSAGNTTISAKTYRFKCDKCSKMYSTSIGLSKHQQYHCPAAECNQEKKQHACQECGKLYTTVGALKMHIRTHTLPCKCPVCGKAFSRPWLLQGHIRTHTGEKPFSCTDCNRSFADRSNLRAHQQTHVDVKKYACQVCNKSFSRMSLLNKHASSNCTITIV